MKEGLPREMDTHCNHPFLSLFSTLLFFSSSQDEERKTKGHIQNGEKGYWKGGRGGGRQAVLLFFPIIIIKKNNLRSSSLFSPFPSLSFFFLPFLAGGNQERKSNAN